MKLKNLGKEMSRTLPILSQVSTAEGGGDYEPWTANGTEEAGGCQGGDNVEVVATALSNQPTAQYKANRVQADNESV